MKLRIALLIVACGVLAALAGFLWMRRDDHQEARKTAVSWLAPCEFAGGKFEATVQDTLDGLGVPSVLYPGSIRVAAELLALPGTERRRPPWAVVVRAHRDGSASVSVHVASAPRTGAEPAESIVVSRVEKPIPSGLAEGIEGLWNEQLEIVGTRQGPSPASPADDRYVLIQQDTPGTFLCGSTPTPRPGSPPMRMLEIAALLRSYALVEEERQAPIEARIRELLEDRGQAGGTPGGGS